MKEAAKKERVNDSCWARSALPLDEPTPAASKRQEGRVLVRDTIKTDEAKDAEEETR